MREFDQGTIPGSDVTMDGYEPMEPIPQSDHRFCIDGTEWLPKTDWSRDHIIAQHD